MSEINSFSDYASKYNTNVDYSYLFGGMQTPSTGSAFTLSDYAAIKNGSYGKCYLFSVKLDFEKAKEYRKSYGAYLRHNQWNDIDIEVCMLI